MSSFFLSNCLLNSSSLTNSYLLKNFRMCESSWGFFYLRSQDWNLAKQWNIRLRSGKGFPVLLTKKHLMFTCELKEGTGNIAELFRLRLRSSGRGVRDTWEGEQRVVGAVQGTQHRRNGTQGWTSLTPDLAGVSWWHKTWILRWLLSPMWQWILDDNYWFRCQKLAYILDFRGDMLGYQRGAVLALPLTSRFSHKTRIAGH